MSRPSRPPLSSSFPDRASTRAVAWHGGSAKKLSRVDAAIREQIKAQQAWFDILQRLDPANWHAGVNQPPGRGLRPVRLSLAGCKPDGSPCARA